MSSAELQTAAGLGSLIFRVTPVVTGDVIPGALDDLVRVCVELAGHGPGRCGHTPAAGQDQAGPGDHDDTAARQDQTSGRDHGTGPGQDAILQPPKPEIPPSPYILRRAADRDADREAAD